MPLIPRHILSKSTFMYGCQCPKRLWLHKFMPEVRDELEEAQQAIFQTGTDVGMLARDLFPGGVDASPVDYFHFQQSVADTQQYIREGRKVIYEAAFQFNGLLCAVDILAKKNGKWYAYEVKSTTSVKPPMLQDAAFQYYAIINSGIELDDFYIVHLNNQYIRQGALELKKLFKAESVLNDVLQMQPFVVSKEAELKTLLKTKDMPLIEVGDQCSNPYPCDFYGFCSKDLVVEVPDYGEAYINKEAIKEFLNQLEYPLYHIDFESWMTAVPEFDGHWPYRQVCFQYSVYIQKTAGAEAEHHAYLADGVGTPTLEFLENLLKVLGKKGTILVYNKAFENTRFKELKQEHPQHEKAVDKILDRVVDLMTPFRSNYRLPEMQGSYSIKFVLPALVPGLNYDDLVIGNGGDASSAFYNLQHETDAEKVTATREALLKYCGLDTLAMVKILEKLNKI